MKNSLLSVLVLVAAATLLAACASSPPSRFYTLNAMPSPPNQGVSQGGSTTRIDVFPVEIPDYLDRPHMVTRSGQNELKLAQYDRWAGSLSDNMSEVLAENLGTLLGTDNVSVNPGRDGNADYAVEMKVLRLDSIPGSQVLLKAQWTVFSGPDYEEVASDVCNFSEKLNDNSYDTIAAAVSKALEQVSRDIAQQIPRG